MNNVKKIALFTNAGFPYGVSGVLYCLVSTSSGFFRFRSKKSYQVAVRQKKGGGVSQ